MRMIVEAIRATGAMPVLITAPPTTAAADAAFINGADAMILAGAFGPSRVVDVAAVLSLNRDRVTPDPSKLYPGGVNHIPTSHRMMADQFLVDTPQVGD